jgi:hypothetical protein
MYWYSDFKFLTIMYIHSGLFILNFNFSCIHDTEKLLWLISKQECRKCLLTKTSLRMFTFKEKPVTFRPWAVHVALVYQELTFDKFSSYLPTNFCFIGSMQSNEMERLFHEFQQTTLLLTN